MTVRRVMGIETEYGVSAPADPAANAMLLSSQVVNAYAAPLGSRAGRARWDYEDEAAAARRPRLGGQPGRRRPQPAHRRRRDDPGLANVILTNGARLYVDHAHPEYSSPGGDHAAGRGAVGQGGGAGDAGRPSGGSRPPRACGR